jgi:hypothetical protein
LAAQRHARIVLQSTVTSTAIKSGKKVSVTRKLRSTTIALTG